MEVEGDPSLVPTQMPGKQGQRGQPAAERCFWLKAFGKGGREHGQDEGCGVQLTEGTGGCWRVCVSVCWAWGKLPCSLHPAGTLLCRAVTAGKLCLVFAAAAFDLSLLKSCQAAGF